MTRRIACLHTADSNVDVFETAYRELGLDPGVALLRTRCARTSSSTPRVRAG